MSGRPRGTVLAYHAIGSCDDDRHNLFVATAAFEQQMAYLSRRHQVVPLARLVEGGLGGSAVAITFDDAYISVFDAALPILEHFRFPATVFAPTAHIGRSNTWDPPSPCSLEIADAEALRAASGRGISVESHGHEHIDMSSAPVGDVRPDLTRSIEVLEGLLGSRPRFLAYPYRTGSEAARGIAQELGFKAAFSIDRPHEGPFAYERVQVTPLDGMRLFALKASGHYPRLRHSKLGQAAVMLRSGLRGRSFS
jgi:peptidoglycan/xylan/chitin deacetylase (PgdA/CDA1 family)